MTLGIAGNAAVFSLFKGLALKPLPGVRDSAAMAVVLSRTNEIGIRMAVGARRADVAWTFLKAGAGLAMAGAALGIPAAALLSGSLGAVLYGVGARDVVAFGGGTAVVMAIALAASLIPAWRAARTDPLAALRHQ